MEPRGIDWLFSRAHGMAADWAKRVLWVDVKKKDYVVDLTVKNIDELTNHLLTIVEKDTDSDIRSKGVEETAVDAIKTAVILAVVDLGCIKANNIAKALHQTMDMAKDQLVSLFPVYSNDIDRMFRSSYDEGLCHASESMTSGIDNISIVSDVAGVVFRLSELYDVINVDEGNELDIGKITAFTVDEYEALYYILNELESSETNTNIDVDLPSIVLYAFISGVGDAMAAESSVKLKTLYSNSPVILTPVVDTTP